MPSQLFKNEAVSFVAAKPFTYRGEPYEIGDDFPQETANNIETLVRARFVIPVIDDVSDKPRHWHRHVRPRDEVLERLSRDRTQLVMPLPPDSNEVVDLDVLTHPEQTPEPEGESESPGTADPEVGEDQEFDPGDHTVAEVNEYLEDHPEDEERVLAAEEAGRGRKGILEE